MDFKEFSLLFGNFSIIKLIVFEFLFKLKRDNDKQSTCSPTLKRKWDMCQQCKIFLHCYLIPTIFSAKLPYYTSLLWYDMEE
jgi:hypothetical protein